jgi:hypothetical protein
MTNVVEVTINLGGQYLSRNQQIHGEIIAEGTTDKNEEYIVFRDAESEEPHRILKRKITNISHVEPITTQFAGD